MTTRRTFLGTATATGAITVLPFAARAKAHAADAFPTDNGKIVVHPIAHASIVLETLRGVIYVDPVGSPADYADFQTPDLIVVTHAHGDHYSPQVLAAVMGPATAMVVNPAVAEMLPDPLKLNLTVLANGDTAEVEGVGIEAIPAYNLTEGRLEFHPEGRDNGYVLTIDGTRVYVAGDTEGTPEMRALKGIAVAFVPMNLPFTMDAAAAASAVAAFAPAYVYPYHYRGRDGGTQDPQAFQRLLAGTGAGTQVRFADWYGPDGPDA